MKQKELTKAFMIMISILKNLLVSIVYTQIFQCRKGWEQADKNVINYSCQCDLECNNSFQAQIKAEEEYKKVGVIIGKLCRPSSCSLFRTLPGLPLS